MDSSKINELDDRASISDVIYRYSTGVDGKDWALFRTCFADPLNADFTSTGVPAPRTFPLDTWIRVVQKTLSPYRVTQHFNSNVIIKVNGDEATAVDVDALFTVWASGAEVLVAKLVSLS